MIERDTYRSQFAAYFAGRLSTIESAKLEAALAHDKNLALEAEALRPVFRELDRSAAENAERFTLSADRLAVIRAAAAHRIVEFPGATRSVRGESRDRRVIFRRLAPALAAAAAIVIGAFAGFSTGRETFDASAPAWRVAAQVAPALAADGDPVHFYPPAYGLEHHSARAAHRPNGVTFAKAAPLNYGLPGPRSAYLARGDSFLLQ